MSRMGRGAEVSPWRFGELRSCFLFHALRLFHVGFRSMPLRLRSPRRAALYQFITLSSPSAWSSPASPVPVSNRAKSGFRQHAKRPAIRTGMEKEIHIC